MAKAEFTDKAQPKAETLTVKSGGWTFLGPRFKVKIPATPTEDGLYKIKKADWDKTIGPVFERLNADLLLDPKKGDNHASREYVSASHGYLAMDDIQTAAFHRLMTCFGAAADSSRLQYFPGNAETNPVLARIKDFIYALYTDQTVLVSKTQLEGLANAARRSIEHAQEEKDVTNTAKQFYQDYLKTNKDRVHYSPGLINSLT